MPKQRLISRCSSQCPHSQVERAYRSAELAEPALDPPGLPVVLIGVGREEVRELTHDLDDGGGEFGLGAFELCSGGGHFGGVAVFDDDGVCRDCVNSQLRGRESVQGRKSNAPVPAFSATCSTLALANLALAATTLPSTVLNVAPNAAHTSILLHVCCAASRASADSDSAREKTQAMTSAESTRRYERSLSRTMRWNCELRRQKAATVRRSSRRAFGEGERVRRRERYLVASQKASVVIGA